MNVIDQAIERLQGNWWQDKGNMLSDVPTPESVCLIIALGHASHGDMGAKFRAQNACLAELGVPRPAGGSLRDLVNFNDHPSTTEEDVLLLMKKASARLDEMEAGA